MAFRLETYKMAAAQRGYPINVVSTKPSTEEDKSVLALIKNIGGKLDMMGQKSQNVEKQAREDHYSKYRLRQSSDRGDYQNKYKKNFRNKNYQDDSQRENFPRDNDSHYQSNYQSNSRASNSWGGSRRQMGTSPQNSQ